MDRADIGEERGVQAAAPPGAHADFIGSVAVVPDALNFAADQSVRRVTDLQRQQAPGHPRRPRDQSQFIHGPFDHPSDRNQRLSSSASNSSTNPACAWRPQPARDRSTGRSTACRGPSCPIIRRWVPSPVGACQCGQMRRDGGTGRKGAGFGDCPPIFAAAQKTLCRRCGSRYQRQLGGGPVGRVGQPAARHILAEPPSPMTVPADTPRFRRHGLPQRRALPGDAIASVLAQTHGDLELLLCDDGSTDETPAIATAWQARDARIRVLRSERPRRAPARPATGVSTRQGASGSPSWMPTICFIPTGSRAF
jgi:hypothetical protein